MKIEIERERDEIKRKRYREERQQNELNCYPLADDPESVLVY